LQNTEKIGVYSYMNKKYMEIREFKDFPAPTYIKYTDLLAIESSKNLKCKI
jgi:hypothetical protein